MWEKNGANGNIILLLWFDSMVGAIDICHVNEFCNNQIIKIFFLNNLDNYDLDVGVIIKLIYLFYFLIQFQKENNIF